MAGSLYTRDAAVNAGIGQLRFFLLAVVGGSGSCLIDAATRAVGLPRWKPVRGP